MSTARAAAGPAPSCGDSGKSMGAGRREKGRLRLFDSPGLALQHAHEERAGGAGAGGGGVGAAICVEGAGGAGGGAALACCGMTAWVLPPRGGGACDVVMDVGEAG